MTSRRENTSLSVVLEATYEARRGPLKLTWRPSLLLRLLELERYKNTVRCAALGGEVPGQHEKDLPQTLIARLLKTHFLHWSLIVLKSTEHN